MNNPNNPRGQTPEENKKPMGDQMGQKAQPKGGKDNVSGDTDLDKKTPDELKKDKMSEKGQPGQRQH